MDNVTTKTQSLRIWIRESRNNPAHPIAVGFWQEGATGEVYLSRSTAALLSKALASRAYARPITPWEDGE